MTNIGDAAQDESDDVGLPINSQFGKDLLGVSSRGMFGYAQLRSGFGELQAIRQQSCDLGLTSGKAEDF